MWAVLVLLTPFEICGAVMAGVLGYKIIASILTVAVGVTVLEAAHQGGKDGKT